MKSPKIVCLLAVVALGMMCERAGAKQLSPRKNGEWLDLQSRGVVFGTIAETSNASKAKVTYFIRRKDGVGEPEKLVSKKGLFAYNLKPGVYEIYDWSLSGSKGGSSKDRFTFEVRAGYLTYIGRIVTNVARVEGESGRKEYENRPYLLDERVYDGGMFSQVYPILAKMDVILAARQGFEWR